MNLLYILRSSFYCLFVPGTNCFGIYDITADVYYRCKLVMKPLKRHGHSVEYVFMRVSQSDLLSLGSHFTLKKKNMS